MLTIARLHRTASPVRPARAWLLSGADPASWFAEVATWPVATHELRFFVLPFPGGVAGVLVVPAAPVQLAPGTRGVPYGEIAPGFYLPTDAELRPPLAPAEAEAARPGAAAVFHPSLGLIAFSEFDRREAADFLVARRAPPEAWNRAVAVPVEDRRLRLVRLSSPPSIEELFGPESNDIGSKPFTDLKTPKDSVWVERSGKAAAGAAMLAARVLLTLTGLAPRIPAIAPTWINRVEEWAARRLTGAMGNLERRRHRELHRLLDLLKNNPEEGLRHAIPLAQLFNRGIAPPGSTLGRRALDFDLSRIGGGRAADFWNIPVDVQSSLSALYRENAQRELKLGNFRRAAYIFGELLGDLRSTADALKQGRFYREAALIYRDRLYQPVMAAECLAEGGLVDEAIELYREKEMWLEIADLEERRSRTDAARAALRKLVEQHLARSDVISAAKVLEQRLREPEEALARLTETWPRGPQALLCLGARLALLRQLGRDSELVALLRSLRRDPLSLRESADLMALFATTAERSSQPDVRQAAADSLRVRAAAALADPVLKSDEEITVLRSLARLAPKDGLLVRDVNRFRKTRALPPAPPAPGRSLLRLQPRVVREIESPAGGTWLRFGGRGSGFYGVLKRPKGELMFVRCRWDSREMQKMEWPDVPPERLRFGLIFSPGEDRFLLARPFFDGVESTRVPPSGGMPALWVGRPNWLPTDVFRLAMGQAATWVLRFVDERIVLASHEGGRLVYSKDLTETMRAGNGASPTDFKGAEVRATDLPLPDTVIDVYGVRETVALSAGSSLIVLGPDKDLMSISMPGPITDLAPGPRALPGWIVLLQTGVEFVKANRSDSRSLATALPAPKAVHLEDGRLLLFGDADDGLVYQVHGGELVQTGWFKVAGSLRECIAAGPGDAADRFATCQASGRIILWQIPVRPSAP